jgi:DNA primase
MARIPDDEIERLKKEVNLAELVREAGIELREHGANLIGRCPFHEDHTPSLVITPGKNLWHCLGACQTGGSVIDWVMRVRSVSFRHAAEYLRGEPAPVKVADDQEALKQVVNYYHETLKESPEALRYLESRGLTHPEMIGHFKIGFANRTLGYRLPEKNRKAGAEIRGRLQALGVLRESGARALQRLDCDSHF